MKKYSILMKIICVAMVLCLVLCAVGCGSDGSKDKTTTSKDDEIKTENIDLNGRTITYMTWWEEPVKGSNQQAVEYWAEKTKIEKEYNCKIEFAYTADSGWMERIFSSILAGNPNCDVFSTEYQHFYGMQTKGLLYPVNELKNFDFSDNSKWWKPGMDFSNIKGKQYGMCASGAEFSLIVYNKDILKQNNQPDLYELQQNGTLTWSKLVEIAKACTDSSKGTYGMAPSQFPRDLLYLVSNAYGGKIVERDSESFKYKCTVNSPEVVNAFSDVNKWYAVDKIVLPSSGDYTEAGKKFKDGKILMHMGVAPPTYYSGHDFELGVCLMPSGRDADSFSPFINMSTGVLSYIPACAENPEEIAAVWNRLAGKTGRQNWEIYYQDYLPEDVMNCLYDSVDNVNNGKYSIDYGYTLLTLWDNNDALFNSSNSFVKSANSAASFIQSLENVYNTKILDMNIE